MDIKDGVMMTTGKEVKKEAAAENGEYPLLLVAVCDIRGFTDLQARVEDYVESDFTRTAEAREVLGQFTEYVRSSMQAAYKTLTKALTDDQRDRLVVKSTGDGLMIAMSVGSLSELKKDETTYQSYYKYALPLITGMIDLVFSDHQTADNFEIITKQFLELELVVPGGGAAEDGGPWKVRIQEILGFKDSVVADQEHEQFKIGGAMTLGTGSIVTTPKGANDVSGNIVNMAFRLCDRSRRRRAESKQQAGSSYGILLDRRAARALQCPDFRTVCGDRYDLLPLGERLELKGIEENLFFELRRRLNNL